MATGEEDDHAYKSLFRVDRIGANEPPIEFQRRESFRPDLQDPIEAYLFSLSEFYYPANITPIPISLSVAALLG
jgi:hypothetical protein